MFGIRAPLPEEETECAHTHLHFLHLQIIKHVNSSRWRGVSLCFLVVCGGMQKRIGTSSLKISQSRKTPPKGALSQVSVTHVWISMAWPHSCFSWRGDYMPPTGKGWGGPVINLSPLEQATLMQFNLALLILERVHWVQSMLGEHRSYSQGKHTGLSISVTWNFRKFLIAFCFKTKPWGFLACEH